MSGFGVLNKAILEYIMDLHMIIRMFWYIMIEPVVPGTQNLLTLKCTRDDTFCPKSFGQKCTTDWGIRLQFCPSLKFSIEVKFLCYQKLPSLKMLLCCQSAYTLRLKRKQLLCLIL